MKIPSMKLRFSLRDAGYLTVIGLLIAWIWMERQRQAAYQELLYSDLKSIAGLSMERHLSQSKANIQQYAGEQEDSIAHQSIRWLRNMEKWSDSLTLKIQEYKKRTWAGDIQNPGRFNKTLSDRDWHQLEGYTQAFFDTLKANMPIHQMEMIKSTLGLDSAAIWWDIARYAGSNESGVLLEDLEIRSKAAQWAILTDLAYSIQPQKGCFSKWMPVLMPLRPDTRVGEMFEADVFLTEIPNAKALARNGCVIINGDTISIAGSAARFQKKYTTPGKKSLQVEIQLRNPITKTIEHFKKEYSVVVQ